jgi:hypothetical protein
MAPDLQKVDNPWYRANVNKNGTVDGPQIVIYLGHDNGASSENGSGTDAVDERAV